MRRLIWIIVIAAALYGGYWAVGARMIDRGLRGWISAQRTEGHTADFGVLRVQGFPSRFDIHAEGVHLLDPASGWGWRAPVVELAALAYRPQQYIAVLPHRQTVETPAGNAEIESADMRANLAFATGPSFVLDRFTFVASEVTVSVSADITLGAGSLRIASARAPATSFGHRLGLEIDDVALPQLLMVRLGDAAAGLPERLAHLHLDATVEFDARWDRHALTGILPQPTRIRLDDLSAAWGEIGIVVSGSVDVDSLGRPQGRLEVTARNWKRVLDLVVAGGRLPAGYRTMLEAGLTYAGAATGTTPTELTLPLVFEGGTMSLGALPLGPAPVLVLR